MIILTSQELQTKELIEMKMSELINVLNSDETKEIWTGLDDYRLQQLLALLIKIHVCKVRTGENVVPVCKNELNGTEAAVFIDQMLKCMEIELFEMQIWRSLGSNY